MNSFVARLLTELLAVVFVPSQAFAWGSEGHRIVAEIAEQYLQPETTHQVRDLLAIEGNTSLADVANWADQIRPQRRNTASWHFVNIPITASGYDPARDCPRSDCVVAKITEFASVLRDRKASPQERLEALKFVVHFVGDLHQPLHASNNNDKGGNEVRVEFDGHRTNLHSLWDTGLLAPVVRGDERAYALQLVKQITPKDMADWQQGTPVQWANESHEIAVRMIYGALPHAGLLPASYEREALPVVDEQLERAGVRLAAMLNKVFQP